MALPSTVTLILLLCLRITAARAGSTAQLAEDLTAASFPTPFRQHAFGTGLKSKWLNLRAKFLRSKTSDRWMQTFAAPSDATPSHSGRFDIPAEDALVRSTPLAFAFQGGKGQGKVKSWSKPATWTRSTKQSASAADRAAEARTRLDAKLNRPPAATAVRGKELEAMPRQRTAPRQKSLTQLEINEIRKSLEQHRDHPASMRRFPFVPARSSPRRNNERLRLADARSDTDGNDP